MKRRKNPGVQGGERMRNLTEAMRLYRDFSGESRATVQRVTVPDMPRELVVVGMLDAIEYSTFREGEHQIYRHEFSGSPEKRGPDCRAMIAVSRDGKQVVILGGNFRFTDRGFVDRGE